MPDYNINKPCRPDGLEYRTKGKVSLTERQAKYLVLSGHLVPDIKAVKAIKTKKADKK